MHTYSTIHAVHPDSFPLRSTVGWSDFLRTKLDELSLFNLAQGSASVDCNPKMGPKKI